MSVNQNSVHGNEADVLFQIVWEIPTTKKTNNERRNQEWWTLIDFK